MVSRDRRSSSCDPLATEVVIVCTQERDRTLIRAARLEERYAIRYARRDLDSRASPGMRPLNRLLGSVER
jgi:hypothetical protein